MGVQDKNNQIGCLLNMIDLETIQVLVNALPQNCRTSKDVMLKLLSLSSKAIVE